MRKGGKYTMNLWSWFQAGGIGMLVFLVMKTVSWVAGHCHLILTSLRRIDR